MERRFVIVRLLMLGTAVGLFMTALAVAIATGDGWLWAGAVTMGLLTFGAVIVLLADVGRTTPR